MGDILAVLKWESQGYSVCLRLLPGQWPSQLGVTHTLSSKVRASFLHPYSTLVIKERAPTPMKMMGVSLCANKWNLTAPCPGEIAEITLQALTEPCILQSKNTTGGHNNQRDASTFVLHFSLKLSTRKKPPRFFFLQVQINCMIPLIQKTNYIYTYI